MLFGYVQAVMIPVMIPVTIPVTIPVMVAAVEKTALDLY
jgi:hypothetical protein